MEQVYALLLFIMIVSVAGYYDHNGEWVQRHMILVNQDKCMMADNFRVIIDRHHNYLRQQVALGKTYLGKKFEEREMSGLVYDCKMEDEARKELEKRNSTARNRGTIRFPIPLKRSSALADLQEALETAVKDEVKLRQMINPKSTRFGCYGSLRRSNNSRGEMVCVYEKKGRRKDLIPKGEPCYIDYLYEPDSVRCTNKKAECRWYLCYVLDEN